MGSMPVSKLDQNGTPHNLNGIAWLLIRHVHTEPLEAAAEATLGRVAARIPSIARIGKGWSLASAGILDRIGAFPRAPRMRVGSRPANCLGRLARFFRPLPLSTRARHGPFLSHGQRLRARSRRRPSLVPLSR